jgi:hypothetical protein
MALENGIAITIRAFLHTGKTLDEQFAALTMMKDAHASGDYSKVLAAAQIDEIKAEPKTRRGTAEAAPVAAPVAEYAPVSVSSVDVGSDFDDLPDEPPGEAPALAAAE